MPSRLDSACSLLNCHSLLKPSSFLIAFSRLEAPYPAAFTASIIFSGFYLLSSYDTVILLASRLTFTSSTPSNFETHRLTLAWQAAQVIPVTLYFSVFTLSPTLDYYN